MPSTAGYWIGCILLALAVIGGPIAFGIGIGRLASVGRTYSVEVPGDATPTLDAGTYELYVSSYDSYGYDTNPTFTVVGPDGNDVSVTQLAAADHSPYHYGKTTLGQFVASQHGGYEIKTATRPDRPGLPANPVPSSPFATNPRTPVTPTVPNRTFAESSIYPDVVTLGRNDSEVASATLPWILGSLAGGAVLVVAGAIVLIVTAVRRSSARKANNPRPPYGPGAPPWAAYPPPAYPGYGPPPGAPPPGAYGVYGPYGAPPSAPSPGPYGPPPGGFGPPR
jgi:hypothetical protein